MPAFLRKIMIPNNWDQSKLIEQCQACNETALRITYEYPRQDDPDLIQVLHMVGLVQGEYLPMMWETYYAPNDQSTFFDFKYMWKNNAWGLNKAAAISRDDLRKLFSLYEQQTGATGFP